MPHHRAPAGKPAPRGIRLNNPGNIRRSRDPWQGLAKKQADDAFLTFAAPKWGIRALARTLITYQDKHGCRTLSDFIKRWAPPTENNTVSYVQSVALRAGWTPFQAIDVQDYAALRPLVEAIIWHENGQQPYTEEELNTGLVLAGVAPPEPKRPLADPAVAGGALTLTSAAASTALEMAWQAIAPLRQAIADAAVYVDAFKWGLIALSFIGAGITIWSMVKRMRTGQVA